MTELDSKALACPFCGVNPSVQHWHGGPKTKRMVSCENDEGCYVMPSVSGPTRKGAIEAWNRRAALPAPAVPTLDYPERESDIERLRGMLEDVRQREWWRSDCDRVQRALRFLTSSPAVRREDVEAALEWLKDADSQATELEQGCDDVEFYASLKDQRRWCSVRGFSIAQSARQATAILRAALPAPRPREEGT
jgi:hypothetical protein